MDSSFGFWKKAIEHDFPQYIIPEEKSDDLRLLYREICRKLRFFGEGKVNVPSYVQRCLRYMKDVDVRKVISDVGLYKDSNEHVADYEFLNLIVRYNRHFELMLNFETMYEEHYRNVTTQEYAKTVFDHIRWTIKQFAHRVQAQIKNINAQIQKAQDDYKIRKSGPPPVPSKWQLSELELCKLDDTYLEHFEKVASPPETMTITGNVRRLLNERVGDPLAFYHAEKENVVPDFFRPTYEFYRKKMKMEEPIHWMSNLVLSSSIVEKCSQLEHFRNESFWRAAVLRDFVFYKASIRIGVDDPQRKTYGLIGGNIFRAVSKPEIVDLMPMINLLISIADTSCVDICDVLMALLLNCEELIREETVGKEWAIPDILKKESSNISELPSPLDYYLSTKKVPGTDDVENTKKVYYKLKEMYEQTLFPEDQVRTYLLFKKRCYRIRTIRTRNFNLFSFVTI